MIRLIDLLQEQIIGMLSAKPVTTVSRFNLEKGAGGFAGRTPKVRDLPDFNDAYDYETTFRKVYNQAKKLNKPATKYSDKQAKLLRDQFEGNLFDKYILSILKTVRNISEFSSLIKSYNTYERSLIDDIDDRFQLTYQELLEAISKMKGADTKPKISGGSLDALNQVIFPPNYSYYNYTPKVN